MGFARDRTERYRAGGEPREDFLDRFDFVEGYRMEVAFVEIEHLAQRDEAFWFFVRGFFELLEDRRAVEGGRRLDE